jgi:hypothetical protein
LFDLGSFVYAMIPLLLEWRSIGLDTLGTTPNLETKFLIQIAFFATLEEAIYSASIVESATISCLELFQLATSPLRYNVIDPPQKRGELSPKIISGDSR